MAPKCRDSRRSMRQSRRHHLSYWDVNGGAELRCRIADARLGTIERRLDSLEAVALGKSKDGCATRYNGRGDDSPHSEVLLEHETGDQDPK